MVNMAEKRVQELLGLMQKTLECSICLDMMNNPVSTGCGHQFCRFCLTEFLGRKRQVPCPLCKKPITKRSLMAREELGDMVDGVRNLISAFQKDTGSLFSPPRGPQTGLLPGTPDSIKTKTSTTGPKTGKNTTPSNIRRTRRRESIDTTSADSTSLTESGSGSRHIVKNSMNGEHKPNDELAERKTAEEIRQEQLLKCIQEGTLNANEFDEDIDECNDNEDLNDKDIPNSRVKKEQSSKRKLKTRDSSRKSSDRLIGISTVSGRICDKADTNLIDKETENIDINHAIEEHVNDRIITQEDRVKLKDIKSNSKSENEASEPLEDNEVEMEIDVDPDIPVLSGNSIAKESESSSGPLFKTPVDPKSLKQSKKDSRFDGSSEAVPKKSLRSMHKKKKVNEHVESDNDGENNSLKMTQEELIVKGKESSRTYCKKDKALFVKEKKSTRKVAEWLKNIPQITGGTESDKTESDEPKGKKLPIRMSKKDVKVKEVEEAMGNKIKHLAKQVQDNSKGLLFEADDFETEQEQNEPIDPASNNINEEAVISLENDSKANQDESNKDLHNVLISEEKLVAVEPVRRKRIFKSRTNNSGIKSESDSEKSSVKTSDDQMVSVTKGKSDDKDTINVAENDIVEIKSQELDLPSSDPYEFKSSQNTPLKVNKKKVKGKTGKLGKKTKGKKQDNKTENVIAERNLEKIWDKNLIPGKTILKTAKQEEIERLNARLLQAEDYDLLTCTQEAAEIITKEKLNKEKTADDKRLNVNSETNAQKKVRFKEPVMSDFIETGKINIIGYRKAKKEMSDRKKNENVKEKGKPIAKEIENENNDMKAGECPLGQNKDVNEDGESDDLSEDYRFHDDSSGTDDLEIEPTQDQFEKPNLEIQPEDIKEKLSQGLDEKSVPETPLVPTKQDLHNTNVIEETPAIFSVPKFNKNLSKPVGKSRKPRKVKTPPLDCVTNSVPETPAIIIYKQHGEMESIKDVKENIETSNDVGEDNESVNVFKEENEIHFDKTDRTEVEHVLWTNADVGSKVERESDAITSPDVEITMVTKPDEDKSEQYEQLQVDNEKGEKSQQLENSELSLTQNSESLLQTRVKSKKTDDTGDQRSDENKSKSEIKASICEQKQDKEVMDIDGEEDCSIVNLESTGKNKTKKKRKSFMLDEAEESLDFGSLSACDTTSVSEESENVSKAKRQRVNRLKRSPKTKEKINENQKCHNEENNSGSSSSIDIIPDTMTLKTGDHERVAPMKSKKFETINVDALGGTKEKRKDFEDRDENPSQVITLSSESGSVLSLEEESTEKESKNSLKKRCTAKEAESRNIGISETADVIEETEIDNREDLVENEMTEGNHNCNIDGKIMSDKIIISDSLRSPSGTRKKRKSGQSGSRQNSQNNIDRVRHLSGILASPQDSLVLSGVKGSPEDIFKIDSEMPSVDFSPIEQDQNSDSLDLGTLVAQDPLIDDVDSTKRISMNETDINGETDNDLVNTDAVHNEKKKPISQSLVFEKAANLSDKDKGLDLDSDTNSGEQRRRVSGIRGFAKRKRKSASEQPSPMSSCAGTDNSVIAETPLLSSSVKYKSPVVKFSSPKIQKLIQSEIIDNTEFEHGDESENSKKSLSSPRRKSKSKLAKNSKVADNYRDTPEKCIGDINASKYSPMLVKHRQDKGKEKHAAKIEAEVVELKNVDDDNDDECMISPNELPDLDNEVVNIEEENIDNDFEYEEISKKSKPSKVMTPKLILSSPDKVHNIMIKENHKDTPKKIVENEDEFKTVIPETMSIDNDDDDDYNDDNDDVNADCHTEQHDEFAGSETLKDVHEIDAEDEIDKNDDDDSINSSTSSEFRLDPSDEKSMKDEALNVISKFEEIVENSIDIGTNDKSKNEKDNKTELKSDNNEIKGKKRKQNVVIKDQNESFERSKTLRKEKHKEAYENLRNIIDDDMGEMDNMYSTRLDSSPASCMELDMEDEPEAVILESDIEEDVAIAEDDDVECLEDKDDLDEDWKVGETVAEMEEEDSDYEVKTKTRKKRVILSDSSSDEEDEGSRHMNLTSSSAFSSQSENITTQERHSLEKEVERMAREMKAMKEQLRKSKEMTNTKSVPDDKCVEIVDSDDDIPDIETNDSDNVEEEDLFLSQPAINPGDLEPDDAMNPGGLENDDAINHGDLEPDDAINLGDIEPDAALIPGDREHDDVINPEDDVEDETLDPAAMQDLPNHDEIEDQVDESLVLPQESFTVPESDPSQLSVSMLDESDPGKGSHTVKPEPDEMKVPRPVLSDLDTNIIPAPTLDTTKPIGIVVTGLNVPQIQLTKKLAALINAKFFSKFNDSVTHVIVKPADEDDTICDRTLKFFQGISRKCWIVNFFWVVDCKQVGHLLPEGPYEIQGDTTNNEAHLGPKRSRLSRDDKLFQKFTFSLIGDNTYLSKDSMTDLINTCGGEVVDKLPCGGDGKTQLVILCTDIDDDDEDVQSIIKHARDVYKRSGVVTLTREWILDSVTFYKIQPLQEYLVIKSPNIKLPKI